MRFDGTGRKVVGETVTRYQPSPFAEADIIGSRRRQLGARFMQRTRRGGSQLLLVRVGFQVVGGAS
jgi:hypothetical protein